MAALIAASFILGLFMPARAEAQAVPQRTVRFFAGAVSGSGSVTPVLTWCSELAAPTAPAPEPTTCAAPVVGAATGCTATGPVGWAGAKAAAGTVTLPAITANQTYALECAWPDDTTIKVSWVNPTQNVDNTPLTDLDRVMFGFRQGAGTITTACVAPVRCETAKPPTSPKTYTGFALGAWRVTAWAVNVGGQFSDASNEATKTNLAAGTIARSVAITVAAKPQTVTGISLE
jgi:hypothetical protein